MPKKKYYPKKKYKKSGFKKDDRNYLSPEYTKWRTDVKKRDNYQCQWPGCGTNKRIQVHHIKTWAKHPGLRYTIANGITLCRKCHDSIKGKEQDFEFFFLKLLEWKLLDQIKEFEKKRKL